MAYGFKLIAKRDIRPYSCGGVVLAKGMSIEHVETGGCTTPQSSNVQKTLAQRFGGDFRNINTVSLYFQVVKL